MSLFFVITCRAIPCYESVVNGYEKSSWTWERKEVGQAMGEKIVSMTRSHGAVG